MSQEKNIQDEIAKVAYELFENSGRMYGCELENWLAAEKIVMEKLAREKEQDADFIGSTKEKKASGKTKPKTLKTSQKDPSK
ncbi:MAG: hypothetical protein A2X59_07990 [Nitrospirae bacterium GWC2_42_7]|nr:MAG: hypothetical protein A2X59_07990 [Nitrospirae bacterium GWC2_42_7]